VAELQALAGKRGGDIDGCHSSAGAGSIRPPARLITALACLLLAACQSLPPKPPATPPDTDGTTGPALPVQETIQSHSNRIRAHYAQPAVDPEPAAPDPDLWQEMRAGFALPGCGYAPDGEHWIERYAASPSGFARVLDEFLPALDYTHRRLRQAGLPSEFALLPIVESHYRPYPAPENRPAGIWQMIGPTARAFGLRIEPGFDGRLNLAASTDAAIALLDRYGDYFRDDWRLVAFAYNAGEFRLRRALEQHQPDEDFDSLQGLGLARTSYDYLSKLLALSCLIREPERYRLQLPTLAEQRRLQPIPVQEVIGKSLAHALSGLSDEEFTRYNGGLLANRTPAGSWQLLAAGELAGQIPQVVDGLPPQYRLGWQRRPLQRGETLPDVAQAHDISEHFLHLINGGIDQEPEPGQPLWLPGQFDAARASASARATAGNPAVVATGPTGGKPVHVVRRGDTLWAIARRHGLTVKQLLGYNDLPHARLRPGQRLRLAPP